MLNLFLSEIKVVAKISGTKGYKSMSKDNDKDVDPVDINKTIRHIIRENYEADEILRDLDFTFDPEKDYYEPKNAVSVICSWLN